MEKLRIKLKSAFFRKTPDGNIHTALLAFAYGKGAFVLYLLGVAIILYIEQEEQI